MQERLSDSCTTAVMCTEDNMKRMGYKTQCSVCTVIVLPPMTVPSKCLSASSASLSSMNSTNPNPRTLLHCIGLEHPMLVRSKIHDDVWQDTVPSPPCSLLKTTSLALKARGGNVQCSLHLLAATCLDSSFSAERRQQCWAGPWTASASSIL